MRLLRSVVPTCVRIFLVVLFLLLCRWCGTLEKEGGASDGPRNEKKRTVEASVSKPCSSVYPRKNRVTPSSRHGAITSTRHQARSPRLLARYSLAQVETLDEVSSVTDCGNGLVPVFSGTPCGSGRGQ